MALDKFPFMPRGEVKITYQWNTKVIDFESGARQYNRTRIHAKKSLSFHISGNKKDLADLLLFYDKHEGQGLPFLFEYDGIEEVAYFGAPLESRACIEVGKMVGHNTDILIEIDKQTTKFPKPSTEDVLPRPYGELVSNFDWKTHMYTTSTTMRRKRMQHPILTITATFTGLKEERDRLIELYNSHAALPLKLYYDVDSMAIVRFPDKIEITDYRELDKIIGYKTTIELEAIGG